MRYFEKAVENYAKHMRKHYDLKLKDDILRFNRLVEQMTADGKCPGNIECRSCPIPLAAGCEPLSVHCAGLSPHERRAIIAMEVRDEHY